MSPSCEPLTRPGLEMPVLSVSTPFDPTRTPATATLCFNRPTSTAAIQLGARGAAMVVGTSGAGPSPAADGLALGSDARPPLICRRPPAEHRHDGREHSHEERQVPWLPAFGDVKPGMYSLSALFGEPPPPGHATAIGRH